MDELALFNALSSRMVLLEEFKWNLKRLLREIPEGIPVFRIGQDYEFWFGIRVTPQMLDPNVFHWDQLLCQLPELLQAFEIFKRKRIDCVRISSVHESPNDIRAILRLCSYDNYIQDMIRNHNQWTTATRGTNSIPLTEDVAAPAGKSLENLDQDLSLASGFNIGPLNWTRTGANNTVQSKAPQDIFVSNVNVSDPFVPLDLSVSSSKRGTGGVPMTHVSDQNIGLHRDLASHTRITMNSKWGQITRSGLGLHSSKTPGRVDQISTPPLTGKSIEILGKNYKHMMPGDRPYGQTIDMFKPPTSTLTSVSNKNQTMAAVTSAESMMLIHNELMAWHCLAQLARNVESTHFKTVSNSEGLGRSSTTTPYRQPLRSEPMSGKAGATDKTLPSMTMNKVPVIKSVCSLAMKQAGFKTSPLKPLQHQGMHASLKAIYKGVNATMYRNLGNDHEAAAKKKDYDGKGVGIEIGSNGKYSAPPRSNLEEHAGPSGSQMTPSLNRPKISLAQFKAPNLTHLKNTPNLPGIMKSYDLRDKPQDCLKPRAPAAEADGIDKSKIPVSEGLLRTSDEASVTNVQSETPEWTLKRSRSSSQKASYKLYKSSGSQSRSFHELQKEVMKGVLAVSDTSHKEEAYLKDNRDIMENEPRDWMVLPVQVNTGEEKGNRGFYKTPRGSDEPLFRCGERWSPYRVGSFGGGKALYLPPETLLYGEFVDQVGNYPLTLFHIIDAAIFDGIDLTKLDFHARRKLCNDSIGSYMEKLAAYVDPDTQMATKSDYIFIKIKPAVKLYEMVGGIIEKFQTFVGMESPTKHNCIPDYMYPGREPLVKITGLLFMKVTTGGKDTGFLYSIKNRFYWSLKPKDLAGTSDQLELHLPPLMGHLLQFGAAGETAVKQEREDA